MAMLQLEIKENVSGNYGLGLDEARATSVLDFSNVARKPLSLLAGAKMQTQAIGSLPHLRSRPTSGATRPCM